MFPLAAEHHLEVRDGVARHFAADAVEAEVGHMMLAATIEAAADLDVQIFAPTSSNCETLLGQPLAQFGGQSARGGDAQLAGVGAGAGDDVDDGAGAGIAKSDGFKCLVEFRQIALADPAKDEILLDGGADRFSA